jgi:hypothetical protein
MVKLAAMLAGKPSEKHHYDRLLVYLRATVDSAASSHVKLELVPWMAGSAAAISSSALCARLSEWGISSLLRDPNAISLLDLTALNSWEAVLKEMYDKLAHRKSGTLSAEETQLLLVSVVDASESFCKKFPTAAATAQSLVNSTSRILTEGIAASFAAATTKLNDIVIGAVAEIQSASPNMDDLESFVQDVKPSSDTCHRLATALTDIHPAMHAAIDLRVAIVMTIRAVVKGEQSALVQEIRFMAGRYGIFEFSSEMKLLRTHLPKAQQLMEVFSERPLCCKPFSAELIGQVFTGFGAAFSDAVEKWRTMASDEIEQAAENLMQWPVLPVYVEGDLSYDAAADFVKLAADCDAADVAMKAAAALCTDMLAVDVKVLVPAAARVFSLHHAGMSAVCTATLVALIKSRGFTRKSPGTLLKLKNTLAVAVKDGLDVPVSLQSQAQAVQPQAAAPF